MLAWGLVGWLIDKLAGTTNDVFLAVGIVLGGAGGVYSVYLRYGKDDRDDG
jgi:F0F1-type ATP synthase assembly protein I